MCASSKLLREAWLQLLKQQPDPAWLVAAEADAAHDRTSKLRAKATSVVRWLLKSLPEAQLAEHPSTLTGLLTIPDMPLQLAMDLCMLGVKVPYKEIAAAARKRVAGEQQLSVCCNRPCYVTPIQSRLSTHALQWAIDVAYSTCKCFLQAAHQACCSCLLGACCCAGVENWIVAQCTLDLASDVPQAVKLLYNYQDPSISRYTGQVMLFL
jgi:hypothetical protein